MTQNSFDLLITSTEIAFVIYIPVDYYVIAK